MTKDILQVIAVIVMLVTSLSMLFRFVKPRGSQADFIIGMLNRLGEDYGEGRIACRKKRS